MLKFATVASGSSGNCSVITDGSTHILIDAGVSARRITTGLKSLGIQPGELSAILITHDLSEAISLSDRVIVLSSRPARVVKEIPIRLTLRDDSLLAARNAPEFKTYFNLLWEELNHG